jgi:hypothetical protein
MSVRYCGTVRPENAPGADRALEVLSALDALLLHVPGQPRGGLDVLVGELAGDVHQEALAQRVLVLAVGPLLLADAGDLVVGGLAGLRVPDLLLLRLPLLLLDLELVGGGQLVLDAGDVGAGLVARGEQLGDPLVLLRREVRAAVLLRLVQDQLDLGAALLQPLLGGLQLDLDARDEVVDGSGHG